MADEKALRELIAKWRETADIWERHNGDPVPAKRLGVERAPQYGRGSVRNWINWLRNCASDVEKCLTIGELAIVHRGEKLDRVTLDGRDHYFDKNGDYDGWGALDRQRPLSH